MKVFPFYLLLCVSMSCIFRPSSMAQTTVTLSNFTYTSDRPEVGKIIATAKGAATPQVKLAGENANFFELGKDNVLRVKKATSSQPNTKWLDLVLESGGKQYTFMIVKDEFVRNRVIAHRGAWKNTGATENSIGALEHAIRLGCEGSEFDVHMSLDSILFVHHDHDVKGIHIEKTPSAELAKLRLPNGENLPTLESYLQAGLNQNRTKLILEIKPSDISTERGQALAKKVVEMVQTHKAQGWVDYISFDYEILLKVKELEPSAKVSYLKADKAPAAVAKDSMYGIDYNQNALQKKPDWIQKAHALGLTVNVWTVNEPEIMDWFLQRKADYITTNEPELLLEKVKDLPLKK